MDEQTPEPQGQALSDKHLSEIERLVEIRHRFTPTGARLTIDALCAEVRRLRELQQRRAAQAEPRSIAQDAFFAGVQHGEKRNDVPIHEAFDAWWPEGVKDGD